MSLWLTGCSLQRLATGASDVSRQGARSLLIINNLSLAVSRLLASIA